MFHFYIPWNRQKTPGVAFHKGTSHLICSAEYWKNFQISFTSSKPTLRSYGLCQNSLKLKQCQFSVPHCALRCQKLKSSSLICVTRKSIIYSFSICSLKLKNKQFFGTKLSQLKKAKIFKFQRRHWKRLPPWFSYEMQDAVEYWKKSMKALARVKVILVRCSVSTEPRTLWSNLAPNTTAQG